MSFLEEEPTDKVETNVHTIWCEKYRPKTLETYVGNDTLKEKVRQYIKENDIPHLFFYGKAGTGKTTLAKLITKALKCDCLYINASDERKIDDVRYKIKTFASSIGFNPIKIIILDEADYLTAEAQAALRNIMEAFSQHTRFILTGNYHERIIDPILSRCQPYEIYPPTKKDVALTLLNILTSEGVKFDKDGVVTLVNSHYPDIRSIINTAQKNVVDGELRLSKEDILQGDIKTRLIDMLKNTNKKQAFSDIRQLVADNSISRFEDLYTEMYEKVDDYSPNGAGDVILTLADGQFQDVHVVDKEICFMATIIKVLRVIK